VGLQTNLQTPKETTIFNNGILALIEQKFHFKIIHSVCLSRYSFIKPTMRKLQTYIKVRSFTTVIFFGHPQGVHIPNLKPVAIQHITSAVLNKYGTQQQNCKVQCGKYINILWNIIKTLYIY